MASLELLKQLYSLSLRGAETVPLLSSQSNNNVLPRNPRGVWSGEMPPRNYTNPKFSMKIFVGGVPWDIDEDTLLNAFRPYGICHVEWPNKTTKFRDIRTGQKPTGYVYIIFQSELSISFLLTDCIQSCHATPGELYFCMKTGPCEKDSRQVQIIPWVVSDSVYWSPYLGTRQASESSSANSTSDNANTVFVGALHGLITAPTLASIMEETYGGTVLQVTINTDKYKYPIGSGRVTFAEEWSFKRAVESEFLEIRTAKFIKKIQIDPFVEEQQKCKMCKCRECSLKNRKSSV